MSNTSAVKHRVTIGVPVYNGERYIEESLRSNLAQTYDDFQLIIADNASTDRTSEICKDYAANDERITYIRNPINLGASKNYAICFDPATSEFFRWSNADDLTDPTLVERCIEILDNNPEVILAYGKTKIIDEHGKLMELYNDNLHLPQKRASDRYIHLLNSAGLMNVIYGLMRTETLRKTALLQNYKSSDINLIAELALYGQFYEIQDHLFYRRMHPQASSWDLKDEKTQKEFWDPSKKKLLLQTWRATYEFFKGAIRAPIPLEDKLTIMKFLTKRAYWNKEPMKSEIMDFIKYGLHRIS